MLVSGLPLLFLSDVSTEASYESSRKPRLRLKKGIDPLQRLVSSKQNTFKRWVNLKEESTALTQSTNEARSVFCSVETENRMSLIVECRHLPASSSWTSRIWNYRKKENQEVCLRMSRNYILSKCPFHIRAEDSDITQVLQASLQTVVLICTVLC